MRFAFAVGSFLASTGLLITGALDVFLRFLIVERKNRGTFVSQFFTRLASPIISFILRLSVRPSFYMAADHLAANLIRDPKNLATALWKLDSYATTSPMPAPLSAAHVFIVSPLTMTRWTRQFATQPQTARRIQRLIGYYPV